MPSAQPPSSGSSAAPTESTADPIQSWRSPRAWSVLVLVTLLGLVSDLWSKSWAFEHIAGFPVVVERAEVLASLQMSMLIPPHVPRVIVPQVLEFTLVLNPGAVFGMGAGQRWFFVAFTGGALMFGLWLFGRMTHSREYLSHAAVGLLLSGGLGNLYDRLVFACVRDFIHPLPGVTLPFGLSFPWGTNEIWPWVSNVADLWLIIAILVLLFKAMRQPEGSPEPSATLDKKS